MTSRPCSPESSTNYSSTRASPIPEAPLDSNNQTCNHIHEAKTIVLCDETFPTSANVLWGLLYGDKPSHIVTIDDASPKPCFFDWFLYRRAVKNLEKTAWTLSEAKNEIEMLTFEQAKVGDCRTLYFDMSVGLQTAASKQITAVTSKTPSSICIESKTTNSGVPFSSSYCTMTYTCIQELEGGLCRLFISYQVKFEKDCYSIIKNPVNQAIKSRIPDFYNDLVETLKLHFKISNSREPSIMSNSDSISLKSVSDGRSLFMKSIQQVGELGDSPKSSKNLLIATIVVMSFWIICLAHLYWRISALTRQLDTLRLELQNTVKN